MKLRAHEYLTAFVFISAAVLLVAGVILSVYLAIHNKDNNPVISERKFARQTAREKFGNCVETKSANWTVVELDTSSDPIYIALYLSTGTQPNNILTALSVCLEEYYPDSNSVLYKQLIIIPAFSLVSGESVYTGWISWEHKLNREKLDHIVQIYDDGVKLSEYLYSTYDPEEQEVYKFGQEKYVYNKDNLFNLEQAIKLSNSFRSDYVDR